MIACGQGRHTAIATPAQRWGTCGPGHRAETPHHSPAEDPRCGLLPVELLLEGGNQACREHGPAIFLAFDIVDSNLSVLEVQVFHLQAQAFEQA